MLGQWFPETARALTLNGAEIIFYPTAIGSEPILEKDSMPHWRRCMQGHSAAKLNTSCSSKQNRTRKGYSLQRK